MERHGGHRVPDKSWRASGKKGGEAGPSQVLEGDRNDTEGNGFRISPGGRGKDKGRNRVQMNTVVER